MASSEIIPKEPSGRKKVGEFFVYLNLPLRNRSLLSLFG
jgi:hypothetical protein